MTATTAALAEFIPPPRIKLPEGMSASAGAVRLGIPGVKLPVRQDI